MKAKALLLAGLVAFAAPAFAQFSNASSSKSSSNGGGLINNCDPYNRITVNYVNRSFDASKNYRLYFDGDDYFEGTNGFSLEYIHGFSLSQSLPLFLETGIGADMGFYRYTYDLESDDLDMYTQITSLTFAVPVNVAYKLQFNDKFALTPYLGLDLKLHALGTYKPHASYDGDNEYIDEMVDEINDADAINVFDKDDMGKEMKWNRFQIGWHIGLGIDINKFYVGLSYGTDFNEIYKKCNTGTFKVGIGFNF